MKGGEVCDEFFLDDILLLHGMEMYTERILTL